MPIRGESVGSAYVRLFVDGSDIPEGIKEEMHKADDSMLQAGRTHSKAYTEGFEEQQKKNPTTKKIEEALRKGSGKFDSIGAFQGSKVMEGLERVLKTRFGDEIGGQIGVNLRDAVQKGLDPASLQGMLSGDLNHLVTKAVDDLRRIEDKADREHAAALKQNVAVQKKHDDEIVALANRALDNLARSHTRIEKENENYLRENDAFERGFRKSMAEIDKTIAKTFSDHDNTIGGLNTNLTNLRHSFSRFGLDIEKDATRAMEKFTKQGDSAQTTLQRFADTVGKATGRGSRNNFFNLIGASARGAVLVVEGLFTVTKKVINGFREVGKAAVEGFTTAQAAGDGTFKSLIAGLSGGISTLGSSLSAGLPGLILFGSALGGLIILAGPLVAIISGLTGAIIALAASLTYAAIGAFAPLLALLAPVGAGLLGVLAIIAQFNTKGSELQKTFQPLVDTVKGLGKAIGNAFEAKIVKNASVFGDALKGLRPLARGIGDALGNVAVKFGKAFSGGQFKAFRDDMTKFIPDAIRQLGDIALNVFGIIGGIIRALIPTTESFLGGIDRSTRKFSEFVNSPDGQEKLKKFFTDAKDSLTALGDALGPIGSLIGQLFDKGKGTGDTIFSQLGQQVQTFVDYLDSHPDSISNFFKNAGDVAANVGRVARAIGDVIDALDSPGSRRDAELILTVVGGAFKALAILIDGATHPVQTFKQAISGIGRVFAEIYNGPIRGAFAGILNGFASVLDGAAKFVGVMAKIPGPIGAAYKGLQNTIQGAADSLHHTADNLPEIKLRINNTAALGAVAAAQAGINGLHGKDVKVTASGNAPSFVQSVLNLVGQVKDKNVNIHYTYTSTGKPRAPVPNESARGRIVNGRMLSWIGEDGPEAVVPLNRPLSQVDPAVRELSAIAQGLKIPRMANGGVAGGGRTIDASGMTIVTQSPDPQAVGQAVIDRLLVAGYF